MIGHRHRDIEDSKSTACQQGTERAVDFLQLLRDQQQTATDHKAQHGPQNFVDPIFINRILHEQTHADHQYQDTNRDMTLFLRYNFPPFQLLP